MKKIIAILLSFVIAFSSTVIATAAEGNFISVSVNTYNDKGEIETDEEVLYTDGKYLYATPDFLENYTAYYYDDENNAFVRSGQKYKLALSSTTVDYKGKNATVKMMSNSKSYTLHNVFTFGEEQYLPLDQMAAFLKVELMVDETSIMLLNSGYSIADASYCFNKYSNILNYSNIVNDIFMGNELLYESYAVLCYFSNTIFGLRVSNLLGSYGQASLYENTLTKCVADNSEFIKAQKDENSFTKKCQEASSLIENATKINKTFKNITTVVKNTYETFGDTKDIANIDIEYIDAKEWGEVFSTLSKCYSYMDFFVKSLSMIEDHKEMLTTAKYYYSGSETNSFNTGLACTYKKFGEDTFNGLIETISESLISDLPKNAVAKFAANAVPYTAVIKGVNAFFKLCGFDLTDSTAYSILFDSDIAMKITDMSTSFENNAGKSKKDTEKYRTSAIFALLAMKHAYETGNKLNKKLGGSDAIYENQITELSARLQLYYRASESEGYDDLDSIISLVASNQKNIESSNIISKAKTINTNDKDESNEQFNSWHHNIASYNNKILTFGDEHINEANNAWRGNIIIYNEGNYSENKTIVKDIVEAPFTVHNGKLYYNNVEDSCIYSCNLDGNNIKKIYEYESLGADDTGYYRYASMIFSGNKMVVTTSLTDSGDDTISIYDLSTHKSILVDNSFEGIDIKAFTYNSNLYYCVEDQVFVIDMETGKRIDTIDLDSFISSSEYGTCSIVSRQKEILYFMTTTQTGYYDYSAHVYSLNLNKLSNKKIDSFKPDSSIYDILAYKDNIYILTGTGAGCGFAKIDNGNCNYIKVNTEGDLGGNFLIVNNKLFVESHNWEDFSSYGFVRVCNL